MASTPPPSSPNDNSSPLNSLTEIDSQIPIAIPIELTSNKRPFSKVELSPNQKYYPVRKEMEDLDINGEKGGKVGKEINGNRSSGSGSIGGSNGSMVTNTAVALANAIASTNYGQQPARITKQKEERELNGKVDKVGLEDEADVGEGTGGGVADSNSSIKSLHDNTVENNEVNSSSNDRSILIEDSLPQPPPLSEQHDIIKQLEKDNPIELDQIRYLIDKEWYENFLDPYENQPGPLDSTSFLFPKPTTFTSMEEDVDSDRDYFTASDSDDYGGRMTATPYINNKLSDSESDFNNQNKNHRFIPSNAGDQANLDVLRSEILGEESSEGGGNRGGSRQEEEEIVQKQVKRQVQRQNKKQQQHQQQEEEREGKREHLRHQHQHQREHRHNPTHFTTELNELPPPLPMRPPIQPIVTQNKLDNKIEESLVVTVSEPTWNQLVQWYSNIGPVVTRRVVEVYSKLEVEFNEPCIHLIPLTLNDTFKTKVTKNYSSNATVQDIIDDLGGENIRIWQVTSDISSSSITSSLSIQEFRSLKVKLMEKPEKTQLYSMIQYDNSVSFIVEQKSFSGWISIQPDKVKGTTGLNNLGNTCYMNSALQCLMHVEELSAYFLTGAYRRDINKDNPIGYGGAVATAFYSLLENILLSNQVSYGPRDFKMTIGRYSSAFAGYSQQDSQEFVAFLLDALHEDLNKIKKKPATEKPELAEDKVNDPEAIRELANECWELHKKRNDSIILDLFAGLYRSVLVCPDCQRVSVTFDPFMDLTLPLPSDNLWIKDIIIVPLEGRPIVYEVAMDAHSTVRQLKEYIVKRLNMTKNGGADRLHCVEVYNYRFHCDYEDRDIVSLKIQPNDISVMYELDRPWNGDVEDREDAFLVPVYNRTNRVVRVDARKPPGTSDGGGRFFGIPFFITLTSTEAENEEIIEKKLSDKYKGLRGEVEEVEEVVDEVNEEGVVDEEEEEVVDEVVDEEEGDEDINMRKNGADVEVKNDYEVQTKVEQVELQVESKVEEEQLQEQLQEIVEDKLEEQPQPSENNNFITHFIEHTRRRQGIYPSYLRNSKPLSSRKIEKLPLQTSFSYNNNITTPTLNQDETSDSDMDKNLLPLTDDDIIPSYEESMMEQESTTAETPQLILPGEMIVCDWHDNLIEDWEPVRIPNKEAEEIRIKKESQKQTIIDLGECLDLFSKTEVLGQDDLWYCSKCKCLRQATKTIDLWRVPDIFTIHLKRFSSFRSFRDKISYVVNFPIEGLDMSDRVADKENYKEGELIYDLIAVDNHYGGLGGGHYTAYAKNYVDNKWYYFDDSSVRIADPEKAITGAAYLLFYRRRTTKPLGGEEMERIVKAARGVLENPPPNKELYSGRFGSSGRSSNWSYRNNDSYNDSETSSNQLPLVSGERFYGEGRTLGTSSDVSPSPWNLATGPSIFTTGTRVGHEFGINQDEDELSSSGSSLIHNSNDNNNNNLMNISNDEEEEEEEEADNDDDDDDMYDANSISTPEELTN